MPASQGHERPQQHPEGSSGWDKRRANHRRAHSSRPHSDREHDSGAHGRNKLHPHGRQAEPDPHVLREPNTKGHATGVLVDEADNDDLGDQFCCEKKAQCFPLGRAGEGRRRGLRGY